MDSKKLSYSDIEYARAIIKNNNLDHIYMLIFTMNDNAVIAYKVSLYDINEEVIISFE